MQISQVQLNPIDPKARTPITGTVSQILSQEIIPFGDGKSGIKQNIVIDGITAGFWPGNGAPLTQADIGKPMEFSCKASMFQNMIQYNISRPRSGGGSGRKSAADYQKDRECKNRGVALSFALDHLGLNLPHAYPAANEMYHYIENGLIPEQATQEQSPQGDEIPF